MWNKMHVWVAVATMMMGASLAQAANGLPGDPAAGEAKAGLCGGCHGFDGNSEDATFPRLAGQYAEYIAKQIRDFQRGLRTNNETMAGMAAMVESEQDARDIGSYFQQQKMAKAPLTAADKKLVEQGEKIFYQGNPKANVYACVNCHGERGRGKAPNVSVFPVIGGQHRDYLLKQLNNFRAGERSNDPAGMMTDIAKALTEEEMQAVSAYLASLL